MITNPRDASTGSEKFWYSGVLVVEMETCATVKVLLIALLLLSGPRSTGIVAIPQANLCVPGVAVQVVCIDTIHETWSEMFLKCGVSHSEVLLVKIKESLWGL